MTTITILPERADSYRALAGDKESTGRTAGEALDALTAQLEDDEGGTFIIVQNQKADEYFSAAQQERLTELMQFRQTRTLSSEEEQELESLVQVELDGARRRAERTLKRLEVAKVGQELHREILAALSQLNSYRFTEIMFLRYINEFSPEEIAAALKEDAAQIRDEIDKFAARIHYGKKVVSPKESKGLPLSDKSEV